MWIERDSNPRTPKRVDLQSTAFNHFATYPKCVGDKGLEPLLAVLQTECLPISNESPIK